VDAAEARINQVCAKGRLHRPNLYGVLYRAVWDDIDVVDRDQGPSVIWARPYRQIWDAVLLPACEAPRNANFRVKLGQPFEAETKTLGNGKGRATLGLGRADIYQSLVIVDHGNAISDHANKSLVIASRLQQLKDPTKSEVGIGNSTKRRPDSARPHTHDSRVRTVGVWDTKVNRCCCDKTEPPWDWRRPPAGHQ
jgi:hypothetical protein